MTEPIQKPKTVTLVRVTWTSFYSASVEIAKRLGVSLAKAEKTLRLACAEGDIHSQREHREGEEYPPHKWSRIAPSEWRDHEIDYDTSDAEGFYVTVAISENDLRFWLDQQAKPKGADISRDAVIRKLLDDGSRPGQNITWVEFCVRVRDEAKGWKDKKEGTLQRGFSEKTIKRSVGQIERPNVSPMS